MICAVFIREGGQYKGFKLSGHAMQPVVSGEYDLICAAVSSAVYLTCNTLTDFITGCFAQEGDNEITLTVNTNNDSIQAILRGFNEHLREMVRQYPKNIILEEKPHA